MARTRTLLELLDDIAERIDVPQFSTSTHITKLTATRWVNQSARVLRTRILDAFGEEYSAKEEVISATAGANQYPLPADYIRTIHMRWSVPGGAVIYLPRAGAQSVGQVQTGRRHDISRLTTEFGYHITGDNVEFWPSPDSAETITHRYISTLFFFDTGGTPIADMTADTDYLDGVSGWEDFVVLDCCIKHANNEEQDPRPFENELARIIAEIDREAGKRTGEPPKILNTYGEPVE